MKQENQDIWVSIEDLNNEPEFIERSKQEFFELPVVEAMSKDEEEIEEATKSSNRRDFLKYMGFGLTAATIAASCEIPVRKAIPYVVKPDTIVPGVATYYASTFMKGGDVCPIIVKTREGRPIKIEGNTMSSMTGGGTSARVQAAVLDLYDTARLTSAGSVSKEGNIEKMSLDALDEKVKGELKPDSIIRIVTSTIVSPSTKAAIEDFKAAYPNTEVVTYDGVSVSGLLDANEASFGKRVVPDYRFDRAKVVVSFGADFLGTWISPTEYASKFIKTRKASEGKMSRLYCLESGMSLTGSNADHRIFVKPSEQGQAVLALYNEVAKATEGGSVSAQKLSYDSSNKAIKEMAGDLLSARGESIVISNSNDTNVQIVVNKINQLLSNYGKTIDFTNFSNQRQGDDKAVKALVSDMKGGKVDVVIINDANPVYDKTGFAEALGKVKTIISCDSWFTETSKVANYLAPQNHFLEAWGDAEAKNSQYSLVQPTISPIHKTRQFLESLLVWAGAENTSAYEYVKAYWSSNVLAGSLDTRMAWDNALHDGVVSISGEEGAIPDFAADVTAAASNVSKAGSGIEVSFYESVNIGAGQYSNNPWLQEMPDPINRTVWDNVLMIPVAWNGSNYTTSDEFKGLKDGDTLEMTIGGNTIETVIVRQFGQMPGTASIALGYGRTEGGQVGKGIGKDVTAMLSTYKDGSAQYFADKATFSGKTGKDKDFACVQMHHTMGVSTKNEAGKTQMNEDGTPYMVDEDLFAFQGSLTKRSIIRHANLSELDEKVDDLKKERAHHQKLNSYSLYDGHDYDYEQGHHWGMAVDLSSCIGCGACQVACVAENNVPMVGKHEVSIHHEMPWIRIDRYFYGDVENPSVVYQPMMCQHCDNAPCENVCPVAATNHSSEGLNQMTYNRCIGTRYCANNCPFKVRRFNWLDYTTADLFAWNEPTLNGEDIPFGAENLTRMVLNPDVTVRSRGVIEKCSFCVQRIQEAKLTAKIEKRALRDGDLKVACQTACPTGAITFGDINDKKSAVSRELADRRTYEALEEVNTQASVGYQMKVLNKNEKIG
ncbi:MAG: MoCo/4Fe-4S cofactor protein with predicted Tat translocation signal [Cognaticolwellia sp.]|jgi:MoCo/4Fe-4S cofactor protein with predicted Tat translocation signal